jgi:hypothetical protein
MIKKTAPFILIEDVSLPGPDRPFYGRLTQEPPYGLVFFEAKRLGVSAENLAHVVAFRLVVGVLLGSDWEVRRAGRAGRIVLLEGRRTQEKDGEDRHSPFEQSDFHWF